MIANFFQLNERKNFYFKHFSLKPIFTPLEEVITPKWGKITGKRLSPAICITTSCNMNSNNFIIVSALLGSYLGNLRRVEFFQPLDSPVWGCIHGSDEDKMVKIPNFLISGPILTYDGSFFSAQQVLKWKISN